MARVSKTTDETDQTDTVVTDEAPEQETQTDAPDVAADVTTDAEPVEQEPVAQEEKADASETPQYLLDEIARLLNGAPEGRYTLVPADRADANQTVKPTGALTADCKMELCEKLF